MQCLYYRNQNPKPLLIAVSLGVLTLALMGGLEAAFVFGLRDASKSDPKGAENGAIFFGALSSAVISLALIPQFIEIWKFGEVIGISKRFIFIDWLGGECQPFCSDIKVPRNPRRFF